MLAEKHLDYVYTVVLKPLKVAQVERKMYNICYYVTNSN